MALLGNQFNSAPWRKVGKKVRKRDARVVAIHQDLHLNAVAMAACREKTLRDLIEEYVSAGLLRDVETLSKEERRKIEAEWAKRCFK